MSDKRVIGIMAGNGLYPSIFAQSAREKSAGVKLVMAAFHGETKEELEKQVDVIAWLKVGQLGKLIKFFKNEGVQEVVMVGQIAPKNLFDFWPDLRALKVLATIKERNAESLFGSIARELEKEGITLLPATTFLEDLMPTAGQICGPKLSERDWTDVRFGYRLVKETSRMDIGQSIVVRRGTVLAVEAFEGTDECIKRGGALGKGKDVTLVKVSKPNQDMRFDVPVIGPTTIKHCSRSGIRIIAIEASKTLLLGKDELLSACAEAKISLVAVGDEVLDRPN